MLSKEITPTAKTYKYIVVTSEKIAQDLNTKLNGLCANDWKDGITNNYCTIKKHPTLKQWAVILKDRYLGKFTTSEKLTSVNLTKDWFDESMKP